MPCNSVAITEAQLSELTPWLLSQLTGDELTPMLMEAIRAELAARLGEQAQVKIGQQTIFDMGWYTGLFRQRHGEVDLSGCQILEVYEPHGWGGGQLSLLAHVYLKPGLPPLVVDIPELGDEYMQRYMDATIASLQATALDLVAELAKEDMIASGFEIMSDTVDEESGARIIEWEKEVYQ